jgi:hypothetical protein
MLFMIAILVSSRCSEESRIVAFEEREWSSECGCHKVSECECGRGEEGAVEATAIITKSQAQR